MAQGETHGRIPGAAATIVPPASRRIGLSLREECKWKKLFRFKRELTLRHRLRWGVNELISRVNFTREVPMAKRDAAVSQTALPAESFVADRGDGGSLPKLRGMDTKRGSSPTASTKMHCYGGSRG
jgi:hypothetical protein